MHAKGLLSFITLSNSFSYFSFSFLFSAWYISELRRFIFHYIIVGEREKKLSSSAKI
jgi:hypothetical protein